MWALSRSAEGFNLSYTDANWIYYEFDWADDR
jgi:hypothetical protein